MCLPRQTRFPLQRNCTGLQTSVLWQSQRWWRLYSPFPEILRLNYINCSPWSRSRFTVYTELELDFKGEITHSQTAGSPVRTDVLDTANSCFVALLSISLDFICKARMSSVINTAKGKRRCATEKLTRALHPVTSPGEAERQMGCRTIQPQDTA